MTGSPVVFSLDSVTKSFGRRNVLSNATLSILPGQCVVVLGGSGAGKSVLMRLLLGFLPPDEGRVRFFGELPPFSPYRATSARGHGLGILFQNDALIEDLTIEQNLALGARAYEPLSPSEVASRSRDLLERVGMRWEEVASLKPSQLSGGMRKRAALARALACRPEALLIDEPTSGLDIHSSRQITRLLREEVRQKDLAAVVITHDLDCARELADRLLLLKDGTLREIDPARIDAEEIADQLGGASVPANSGQPARQTFLRQGMETMGFAASAVAQALPFPSPREFARRLRQAIVDSLPLVISIFLLIGMIIFVQTRAALAPMGMYNLLPDALAEAGLKLTPAFLGLIMAGRLGSVICAEVGLLRQTEQLDAMRVLGLPPERQILSPALWAGVVALPVLALVGEAAAVGGSLLMLMVPSQGARIGAVKLAQGIMAEVEMPLFLLGLFKAVLFGAVIVLCGYFFGARDQRGSAAIGRSITGAIVVCFLAIVALDFVASLLTLGV